MHEHAYEKNNHDVGASRSKQQALDAVYRESTDIASAARCILDAGTTFQSYAIGARSRLKEREEEERKNKQESRRGKSHVACLAVDR